MAGESHAAGAAGEASGGFPPFDASLFSHQIFWWAIAFGSLYLVVANVVLPRLVRTIETRRSAVEADLRKAEAETAAAQAARASADQAASGARAEARRTVDAVRKAADDAAAEAEAKAAAEASAMIAAAEARIEAARSAALVGISDAVGDLASDIVVRVGGAKPTAAALKKAVDAVSGAA